MNTTTLATTTPTSSPAPQPTLSPQTTHHHRAPMTIATTITIPNHHHSRQKPNPTIIPPPSPPVQPLSPITVTIRVPLHLCQHSLIRNSFSVFVLLNNLRSLVDFFRKIRAPGSISYLYSPFELFATPPVQRAWFTSLGSQRASSFGLNL